jgi:hypothetical protein
MLILQPDGYFTSGTPPIFVEADRLCEDCGKRHNFEKCPKCGAWIHIWYGLGGLKHVCDAGCGWYFTRHDSDMSADLTGPCGRAHNAPPADEGTDE